MLAGLAPLIWGSTYIVTTQYLSNLAPMTIATLRALPAGLFLLLLTRQLPRGVWWLRALVLGAFNFPIFWSLLFLSAQRLPGGVAATLGAVQPLLVVFLASKILDTPIRLGTILAAAVGAIGVALLVIGPKASLDGIGVAAALSAAASAALGIVLTGKWRSPVPLPVSTAWQLTAGGIILLICAIIVDRPLPRLAVPQVIALAWLGLVGAALASALWFDGVARLAPLRFLRSVSSAR